MRRRTLTLGRLTPLPVAVVGSPSTSCVYDYSSPPARWFPVIAPVSVRRPGCDTLWFLLHPGRHQEGTLNVLGPSCHGVGPMLGVTTPLRLEQFRFASSSSGNNNNNNKKVSGAGGVGGVAGGGGVGGGGMMGRQAMDASAQEDDAFPTHDPATLNPTLQRPDLGGMAVPGESAFSHRNDVDPKLLFDRQRQRDPAMGGMGVSPSAAAASAAAAAAAFQDRGSRAKAKAQFEARSHKATAGGASSPTGSTEKTDGTPLRPSGATPSGTKANPSSSSEKDPRNTKKTASAASASTPFGSSAASDPGDGNYIRSRDAFASRRVELNESFTGSAEAREIQWWENVWYNYIRYFFTREYLVGKDRFGNRFVVRWYFQRNRHEERKVYRVDNNKKHQPYGALPTDSRLWEAWLRQWRHDAPTPEEEEWYRQRTREKMGVHCVGDEEVEDAVIRGFTQTKHAASVLQELDPDENYNSFLENTDQRTKDNDPAKESDRTWTAAFVRGDLFYNEEEVETMRSTMSHLYRDRAWQRLEMKRQNKHRQQSTAVRKPADGCDDPHASDGEPINHVMQRTDAHVPFGEGVPDLTTPELEKLRIECDALDEERVNLRKELGLTILGDMREGREPIDKGYAPFQPPPTSDRWKPRVWQESWGVGGGMLI